MPSEFLGEAITHIIAVLKMPWVANISSFNLSINTREAILPLLRSAGSLLKGTIAFQVMRAPVLARRSTMPFYPTILVLLKWIARSPCAEYENLSCCTSPGPIVIKKVLRKI
jgi:hypothetical protein